MTSAPYYCKECKSWVMPQPGWAQRAAFKIISGTTPKEEESCWDDVSQETDRMVQLVLAGSRNRLERALRLEAMAKLLFEDPVTAVFNGKEIECIPEIQCTYRHALEAPEWVERVESYVMSQVIEKELRWGVPFLGTCDRCDGDDSDHPKDPTRKR